ncbi:hypothetical protein [Actinomadura graeca]|nr:hypothetical protein [Actinomadura graeca]
MTASPAAFRRTGARRVRAGLVAAVSPRLKAPGRAGDRGRWLPG